MHFTALLPNKSQLYTRVKLGHIFLPTIVKSRNFPDLAICNIDTLSAVSVLIHITTSVVHSICSAPIFPALACSDPNKLCSPCRPQFSEIEVDRACSSLMICSVLDSFKRSRLNLGRDLLHSYKMILGLPDEMFF